MSEVEQLVQESERATALARDLVIKYLPSEDESGSGREECLEVAAGRMMKKLLHEVPIGEASDESYSEPWMHATIHLNPETGEIHSDGDHRVRKWIEERIGTDDEGDHD